MRKNQLDKRTTENSEVALSLNNVVKSYGNVIALNDVSFELKQGFYALLGPNGAR